MSSPIEENICFDKVPSVSPQEAKMLLDKDKDYVLLDARTKMEYDKWRIEEAKLYSLDTLMKTYKELDRSKKYLVICLSGGRSACATYALRQLGFEAFNIKGGMLEWPYETIGSFDDL
ncbi:MAG: rhodanese-like domain-containing protein [Hydrogenobaculum sp.]